MKKNSLKLIFQQKGFFGVLDCDLTIIGHFTVKGSINLTTDQYYVKKYSLHQLRISVNQK